ncbi:MAG: efflux RND transporter periplasmic adaptor subunit [Bacteroidales bacterium]|jgi:membrane fusion protein (multidrug efflux system)|nr:efflux RND transporter periplasmic adaptor subunit [Bacteroidales bacterium]
MNNNFIRVILVLVFLSGCQNSEKEIKGTSKKVSITVTKSEKRSYSPGLTYSGTAKANKEANLGTAIPGRVEKIYVREGEPVARGELIVELSSELYLQALVENQALEKDFERIQRLREKGSVTQQDFDHLKAKYEASSAKTRLMKKNTEIRAPFSGTVVDYIVHEGENFLFSPSLKSGYSMTSGVVKLMQLDILRVEIEVNEKDLSRVSTNQEAEVVFDAYPQKKYTGKVDYIAPILSTLTRTAKVEIVIPNKDFLVKPGMYARVTLALPEQEAVFVPLEAIYRQPGTGADYVFRIEENRAHRVPIQRLASFEDQVAVSGIGPDLIIAVAGKNKLNEGTPVEIKQ